MELGISNFNKILDKFRPEKYYDAEEILSHPLDMIDNLDDEKSINLNEKVKIPSFAHRFLENSYLRRYLTLMGPELHIHIEASDTRKLIHLYNIDANGDELNQIIGDMTKCLIKSGFKEDELINAAKMSGYSSYIEHAKALFKVGIIDFYDKAKNSDGSIDIHQPGIFLVSPIKKTKVGNQWFKLPTVSN